MSKKSVARLFLPTRPRKLVTYSVRLNTEQETAVRDIQEKSGCRGVATLLMLAVGFAAQNQSSFVRFVREVQEENDLAGVDEDVPNAK